MNQFSRDILGELQKLIENDDIVTMTFRPSGTDLSTSTDASIKLIHEPSGTEVICSDYDTQIENKAMALVRLASTLN